MKIRNGFVSNSSSSSFIVALAKKLNGKIKLTIEVDLNSHVESAIDNIDDLNGYYVRNYTADYKNDTIYQNAKKAIEEGKVVFMGEFNSDGEVLERFLCDHGLNSAVDKNDKDICVILGDGGY